jgi:hypothetical protein
MAGENAMGSFVHCFHFSLLFFNLCHYFPFPLVLIFWVLDSVLRRLDI